jgi:predicted amidophosphoribosyltransferase
MLDGKTAQERFSDLSGAIRVHPKRRHRLAARSVLLVDDVMTTGATLTACTRACLEAGAHDVCVLTLARVAKDA